MVVGSWCHDNLRDIQAFKSHGIPITSTSSNQAVKHYDGLIRQLVSYVESPELGGLVKSLQNMKQADPDFVMCKVMSVAFSMGMPADGDPELIKQIDELKSIIDGADTNQSISEWELLHARAVVANIEDRCWEACGYYELLLSKYPCDIHALQVLHSTYLMLGDGPNMRDCALKVLPLYKQSVPMASFVNALLGFGYEECGALAEAEKYTKLQHNRFTGHNTWHLALHHVEAGNFDAAIDVYEKHAKSIETVSLLDVADGASLLWRLRIAGVPIPNEKYSEIARKCEQFFDWHTFPFYDSMIGLAVAGADDTKLQNKFMHSLQSTFSDSSKSNGDMRKVLQTVGEPLLQGIQSYSSGHYAACVQALYPVRQHMVKMGGSHAQRDVFNQMLVHACIKSADPNHHKYVSGLLGERKPQNDNIAKRLEKLLEHD